MKSSSKQMNLVLTVFVGLFLQYIPQQAYAQLIKRTFPQEKLSARIKQLAEITDKTITFDASQVGNIVVPALAANNYTLEQLLTGSLHTTGYTFRYINNSYVIFRKKVDEDKDRKKKSTGTGNLSGFILDQKGEPLVGATVRIPNTSFGTVTNAQGKYSLKSVPAGTVTIEVSYISFQTQKITEVKINPAKTTELDLVMKEANEELGEVVVTAEYSEASAKGLYAKQKAMTAMSDGVSADLIKKTSDSNVAQVLKRVSGVNIQDNKYVTVRGMSERYNNVQLNGTVLPSTEPNRRNFAFDIIPSNLVENVTILKTFTPDMQGEFTGGMVNVSTLSIPKERLLSLSVGSGFNTNSTGKTFMSGKRFKSDYFLGNSSERDWFGRDWVNDTYAGYWNNGLLKPEDAEKAYAMNAKIPNHWGLSKYTAAPTQNYALSIGTPFDLGDHNTLGVVVAATYRHEENTETVLEANYRKTGQKAMDAHNYKFATAIGALANVGWERPGHKITLSNMFNNRFTQSSMDRMVEDKGSSRLFLEHYSSPLRNILWQSRLEGEHKLFNDKLIFSWFGDYNKLTRESHDDRLMQGDVDYTINKDGSYEPTLLSNGRPAVNWISRLALGAADLSGGFIMYSDLSETKKNVGGNFTVPFLVAGNKQSLKAGYWGTFRNADYHQQYLTSKYGPNSTYSMFNGLTLPEVYSSDNFAKGYLIYELAGKKGNKVDYYRGDQKIHAAYLMGEFTFLKRVHVTGGVRMENTKMNVSTYYSKSNTTVDSVVVRNYTDYLPAATVVWNITSSLNLRAAYGKTLARPDFRELTPFRYYNVNDRLIVSGITPLKTTYTSNVDLRLEWYPSAGEIVSVSAFYKKFKDPVELLSSDPQTSGNFILSSYNLDKSTMKGLELNLRKSLAFIAPVAFLRDLYLNANATILKGDVSYNLAYLRNVASGLSTDELDNFASNRKRPLQGMAPYMVNAGLTYSGKLLGAAVSYATTGRKLVQAAPKEWNDEYEAPRHVLDLQLSVRPWRNLEIKANASDILNQASIIYINSGDYGEDNYDMGYNKDRDVIRSKIKRGTSYSFSVSYNF
ncbi:TonB-dependent receptor domain-containing protein [uncultured Bacteroides sp.]|uniref:TonB-dependent receptor n=1 Tax=uncultured Bacteroides sp. TaxID=162156 RepID=UPI002AAAA623|nr:TonB-dependent receptor [uncultured Bacteroides sp.]